VPVPNRPSRYSGQEDESVRCISTGIPGLKLFMPKVFRDERGFFMESFNRQALKEHGVSDDFVQDNHSRNEQRGILRGLHFQLPPRAQTKLVRVIRGSVYDVAVDLRAGSPSYGKWFGVTLSASNFLQLYIPKGFAHGYIALEDETEFMYKVDEVYSPDYDSGLRWNDPDLNIVWPETNPVLSAKDRELGAFSVFRTPFVFTDL